MLRMTERAFATKDVGKKQFSVQCKEERIVKWKMKEKEMSVKDEMLKTEGSSREF